MKYFLMMIMMTVATSAFAQQKDCSYIAARQAQLSLNKFVRQTGGSTGVFSHARIDRSLKPYISNNEAGYTNISFEARLFYTNKKYNSRVNDLMVVLSIDENCAVKSSQVLEISAE